MKYSIFTPTVTIFDSNEKLDFKGNEIVVNHLIDNGVNGLLPLGSTGEFTGLSMQERKDILKLYCEINDNRVEIFAGSGCMNIKDTIELSNYSLGFGIKGALIMDYYYYAQDQQKIYSYYDKLAKNIDGDIYIYNFPARSGHNMEAETLLKLCQNNKNIKGIKDSTGDLTHTKDVLAIVKSEFDYLEVYSGYDDHFIPNIIANGNGCIAALSNIVPEIWAKWIEVASKKDFNSTFKIAKIIDSLMLLYRLDCNFAYLFKILMKYRGLDISTCSIFPFEAIDKSIIEKSKKILDKAVNDFGELHV